MQAIKIPRPAKIAEEKIDEALAHYTADSSIDSESAFDLLENDVLSGLLDIATMIGDGKDDMSNIHPVREAALLVQEAARRLVEVELADPSNPTLKRPDALKALSEGDERTTIIDRAIADKGVTWYASKDAISYYKDAWLHATND